jgi:hypothetical protein
VIHVAVLLCEQTSDLDLLVREVAEIDVPREGTLGVDAGVEVRPVEDIGRCDAFAAV